MEAFLDEIRNIFENDCKISLKISDMVMLKIQARGIHYEFHYSTSESVTVSTNQCGNVMNEDTIYLLNQICSCMKNYASMFDELIYRCI